VDYVVVENYRLLSIEKGLGVKAENAGCRNVVFPSEKVRCDALQSTKRDDKDFSMFLLEGGVDWKRRIDEGAGVAIPDEKGAEGKNEQRRHLKVWCW
jgi:hypothetical protein